MNFNFDPDQDAWMEEGLCREIGGNEWFPPKGERGKEALRICQDCPVKARCLQFALENRDLSRFGIWGGTTERERRRMWQRPAGGELAA